MLSENWLRFESWIEEVPLIDGWIVTITGAAEILKSPVATRTWIEVV